LFACIPTYACRYATYQYYIPTTFLTLWFYCTGSVSRNALGIKLRSWFKVLHRLAPRYLGLLTRVVDLPGRHALRSAGTNRLHIPRVRLSTVGTRALSVAEPSTASGTIYLRTSHLLKLYIGLYTFCHRLKTHLFQRYP